MRRASDAQEQLLVGKKEPNCASHQSASLSDAEHGEPKSAREAGVGRHDGNERTHSGNEQRIEIIASGGRRDPRYVDGGYIAQQEHSPTDGGDVLSGARGEAITRGNASTVLILNGGGALRFQRWVGSVRHRSRSVPRRRLSVGGIGRVGRGGRGGRWSRRWRRLSWRRRRRHGGRTWRRIWWALLGGYDAGQQQ